MNRPAPAAVPIHYPSSDGKPMAENDARRNAIMYGISALTRHFRGRRDVYVSGDLLIYYEEGNPRVSIAPDVFVVFGVEKRERLNYKLWEERRAPAFVLEVASPSTWREDVGRKRDVYARLGVREYWQYDPSGEHLPARLQGERLTRSGHVRQPVATALDGTLTLRSETLGLELRAAPGREMRFRDPATGLELRSHDEEAEGRLEEAAARRVAEARVAELEALLRERSGCRPGSLPTLPVCRPQLTIAAHRRTVRAYASHAWHRVFFAHVASRGGSENAASAIAPACISPSVRVGASPTVVRHAPRSSGTLLRRGGW